MDKERERPPLARLSESERENINLALGNPPHDGNQIIDFRSIQMEQILAMYDNKYTEDDIRANMKQYEHHMYAGEDMTTEWE